MRKAIRRYLHLDTWGNDIYRLKRRLGTVVQDQDHFDDTQEQMAAVMTEMNESLAMIVEILAQQTENELLFEQRLRQLESRHGDTNLNLAGEAFTFENEAY